MKKLTFLKSHLTQSKLSKVIPSLLYCIMLILIAPKNVRSQSISPTYVYVGNDIRMSNMGEMFFRGGTDQNHGLGWYGVVGNAKVWDNKSIDGPVLYGYGGGALGTNQYGSKKTVLKWNASGQVAIGDVNVPAGYGLYVEKGILTEHVRVAVKTSNDWKDYVFDTNYPLLPLNQLAIYIKENHHLPEISSATEVVKSGIDLQE